MKFQNLNLSKTLMKFNIENIFWKNNSELTFLIIKTRASCVAIQLYKNC